jgi:hypothetical protein
VLDGCTVSTGAVFNAATTVYGPNAPSTTTFQLGAGPRPIPTLSSWFGTIALTGTGVGQFLSATASGSARLSASTGSVWGALSISSTVTFTGPVAVAAAHALTIVSSTTGTLDGAANVAGTLTIGSGVTLASSFILTGVGTLTLGDQSTLVGPGSIAPTLTISTWRRVSFSLGCIPASVLLDADSFACPFM